MPQPQSTRLKAPAKDSTLTGTPYKTILFYGSHSFLQSTHICLIVPWLHIENNTRLCYDSRFWRKTNSKGLLLLDTENYSEIQILKVIGRQIVTVSWPNSQFTICCKWFYPDSQSNWTTNSIIAIFSVYNMFVNGFSKKNVL